MANRLREIRLKLNLTQQAMAVHLGIGKSALSMIETGKASLSQRNKNILVQKLNINPEWLSSGEGDMFSSGSAQNPKDKSDSVPIPLYDIETNFTLSSLFKRNNKTKPIDYLLLPNLANCDGAVYVMGDSMYPRLNAGDIIVYKKMSSLDDIFWGETYLLSLELNSEEYVTVKVLGQSDREGFIKLISENKNYPQKEVDITKIKAIAMIKASISIR